MNFSLPHLLFIVDIEFYTKNKLMVELSLIVSAIQFNDHSFFIFNFFIFFKKKSLLGLKKIYLYYSSHFTNVDSVRGMGTFTIVD